MSDLRDQLRARTRPTLDYELPVGDVAGANLVLAQAQRAFAEARRALGAVDAADDPDGVTAAEKQAAVAEARTQVAEAEEALAACYAHIRLTAMPPDDYEALVALHPPRPDSQDTEWDGTTFPKACFLACATDLTPEEWEPFLTGNLSFAERDDLFYLAQAVNVRLVNKALPKGSTPTRIS